MDKYQVELIGGNNEVIDRRTGIPEGRVAEVKAAMRKSLPLGSSASVIARRAGN